MMNSSFDSSDADDFLGANPFRSSTAPPPQQQQQQPYIQQQGSFGRNGGGSPNHGMMNMNMNNMNMQQGGLMNQQPMQQQPNMMMNQPVNSNPYMQQHQQQQNYIPDANSGLTGEFNLPQPPSQPPVQQQPYNFSGTMDTGGAVNQKGYGSGGTTNQNDNGNERNYSIFSWRGLIACCRLDTYAEYFNVDTIDIYLRLKAALFQFYLPDHFRTAVLGESPAGGSDADNNGAANAANNGAGAASQKHGPDLYGPFWLAMTVIFCIGVTSNLSAYMHTHKAFSHTASTSGNETSTTPETASEEFDYDLEYLLRAFSVICTFSFVVPTCFWLGAQCIGMPGISLVLWLCIYGYSLTPILVASWIAWIPIEILEWTVLAVACTMSVLLIVRNLSTPLLQQDSATHTKAAPFILAILAVHFFFCVILKFMFYK